MELRFIVLYTQPKRPQRKPKTLFWVTNIGKNQKLLPFICQMNVLRYRQRRIPLVPAACVVTDMEGVKVGGGPIGIGVFDPGPPGNPPGPPGKPPGPPGNPPGPPENPPGPGENWLNGCPLGLSSISKNGF